VLLADDIHYREIFDRFEYLLFLICADYRIKRTDGRMSWGPPGCFAWRYDPERSMMQQINGEAAAEGENWPVLRVGLFDGSLERFISVQRQKDQDIQSLMWRF
jgi:hypothetical protein